MNKNKSGNEADISKTLVNRILAGDETAETEMVDRYERMLKGVLYNRCGDAGVAGDVTNETWGVVLVKVRNGDLKDKSKLGPFIGSTGRKQLLMYFRKEGKYQGDEEGLPLIPSNEFSPEQNLVGKQLGQAIQKAMSKLVKRDRELLVKVHVVGKEKKQLCVEYKLKPAHFDRVMYRAKNRFKAALEEVQGEDNE